MNSRQREPRSSWLGRVARGRRLDRNPLRRGSDRAETVILAVLAAGFAAAAPFAAVAAGTGEHAAAQREQAAQVASWRLVPAVVSGTPASASAPGGAVAESEATARWTAPDGTRVVSQIPVPLGTTAGSTVRIWVSHGGGLAQEPMRDSQVADRASLAEAWAVAALAAAFTGTGLLARRGLDKRRLAAWESDWRAAGPRWTTRT